MNDLILRSAARFLLPVLILFSVFLLVRGHDAPGGGFVGALVAAGAATLFAIAYDAESVRRFLRVDTKQLAAAGLLVAFGSGLPGMLAGAPFLTGRWIAVPLGPLGTAEVGTPLLFDAGVYLAVIGSALTVVFTLLEEE